ncbi:hypothetical protein [Actinomadura sp. 3N407]
MTAKRQVALVTGASRGIGRRRNDRQPVLRVGDQRPAGAAR